MWSPIAFAAGVVYLWPLALIVGLAKLLSRPFNRQST
jgi:hypothetical protein